MADGLYLNLWFPSFVERDIPARLLSVTGEFPKSELLPGVGQITVHAVSFSEPFLFSERFDFRAEPVHAVQMLTEFLNADCAYELEIAWDLWVPVQEGDLDETWQLQPSPVTITAFSEEFGERDYQENGHIQIDFGLDTPFLQEDVAYTPEVERRIKSNIQKLVAVTQAIEKNCGISGRVLWSESVDEANLAQKLIAKLQRVQ